ncbi:hypothetical protein [Nocardia sp. NPDC056100]|uniref:hypothetical protein n=1 Tax=Nocardia sp. NPDC056100 TaxID=3345712 RepID=UPI0035E1A866
MDRSRARRLLGDAMWVLAGMLVACVFMVGGLWWLGNRLDTALGGSAWDGEVPFIVYCPPALPCTITSVPERTPRLAIGRGHDTISASPQPQIAGLRTGNQVMCTVHVEIFAWGQAANDPQPTSTVTNCRRA